MSSYDVGDGNVVKGWMLNFHAVNEVDGDAPVHRSCMYTRFDGRLGCRRWESN